MGQDQKATLKRPPESGTQNSYWSHTFQPGSQSAEAIALFQYDDDPEVEVANRLEAEQLARTAAIEKYRKEYQDDIDWAAATILVSHHTTDVSVYINVRI